MENISNKKHLTNSFDVCNWESVIKSNLANKQ